jgi:hypothetical protein
MRQENSVLFALRDLRSIEAERVAEERRAEESRRLEQERRRAAEEQQGQADAAKQASEEALRRTEREAHEQRRAELESTTLRNQQLEDDVRQLRAMLSSNPHPRTSRSLWPLLLAIPAAAIITAPLLAWQHPVPVQSAISFSPPASSSLQPAAAVVPTQPQLATSTETPARTPTAKPHPLRRPAKHKNVVAAPPKLDCSDNDPLCGAGLE